ncbi:hypothetical protein J4032_12870 [Streptomyces formicae]|uniref:Zinc finger CHC2-type domain-containing protein n=1 Tax=Streptomyces formicae TaxID=1616117 RepID=A0ABY3WP00_9ACTN|nr:hypothetical protein J4032_12870 [Streptomyces formicae]
MRVNAEKGVFYCHSCGAAGTAIHLIKLMEGCDFADAERRAESILRERGVDVPSRSRGGYQRPGVSAQPGLRAGGRRYVPPGRR